MSDPTGTEMPAQAPTMGLFSSEFLSMVGTMIGLCLGVIPQQYIPLAVALVGVYMALRTLLKVVHQMGYAKSIPDLPIINAPSLPEGSVTTTVTTVPKSTNAGANNATN